MLDAATAQLGRSLRTRLGVGPQQPSTLAPGIDWIVSGHPVPTEASVVAARRVLDVAMGQQDSDLLLVLLSGGASALMAVPVDGVTLADKQQAVRTLLKAGATIHALNCVRKHLSAIKGGRLAAATRGMVVTLAISDVVGDDLSVIGSGPTVPDPSTFADALHVVDAHGGRSMYPSSVVARFVDGAAGRAPETPKVDDPRLARASTHLIGGRRDAVDGAAAQARQLGYDVLVLDDAIVGEAREAAETLAETARRIGTSRRHPLCLLGSGETTVHVRGRGLGGRNQEFALAMSAWLQTLGDGALFLSGGTDGIDGPTDAAGAMVDGGSVARGLAKGLQASSALADNDSYHFLDATGDLVRTGPTGTNVGDLQILLLP